MLRGAAPCGMVQGTLPAGACNSPIMNIVELKEVRNIGTMEMP